MRRAVRLGSCVFLYSLWVAEYERPATLSATSERSAAGSSIVWVSEITTPDITLVSGQSGWLSQANRDALMSMYADIDTESWELEYADGTVESVRFRWEDGIEITPVAEAQSHYTATINLERI